MSDPTHSMSVRDIMAVNVVTMPPDATVREVASRMAEMDIGSIIIMDRTRAVGMITESDIARRVVAEQRDPKATKASEVMSSPLVHVTPDTALTEAMRVMAKSNIRRVAVLKNDTLAGIITSRDILRWSPELIDVLMESLRVRNNHGVRDEEEEDELIAFGGICDSCGEYSTDLALIDGRYLCEVCRT
ncbi:MAG: cyclic nucleotide-binding/CBS domain-containing protein [Candidatus Thorarchaeota archaeon]